MIRFNKAIAVTLAMATVVAGVAAVKGSMSTSGSVTAEMTPPTIEGVLVEHSQSLRMTLTGAPGATFGFRLIFSLGGGQWQSLGEIPGTFDDQGRRVFDIPLSVFQSAASVDAIMDVTVWNNGFETSMPWGLVMRRIEVPKSDGEPANFWHEWEAPLPGTSAPTFTMSIGTIAGSSPMASRATSEILAFVSGPAQALQLLYSAGIEGMLPVN